MLTATHVGCFASVGASSDIITSDYVVHRLHLISPRSRSVVFANATQSRTERNDDSTLLYLPARRSVVPVDGGWTLGNPTQSQPPLLSTLTGDFVISRGWQQMRCAALGSPVLPALSVNVL